MSRPRKKEPLDIAPWSGLRRAGTAVIEGYVEAARAWETIVEISPSPHTDARAAADFIIRAVTEYPLQRALIRQLTDALEICLESGNLTWEAEHDAEIALARARSALPGVAG